MDVEVKAKTRRRHGPEAFGGTKTRTAAPMAPKTDEVDAIMTSNSKRKLSEGPSKPRDVDYGAVPVGLSDAEDNLLPDLTKRTKIGVGTAMVEDSQKANQVVHEAGTSSPPT